MPIPESEFADFFDDFNDEAIIGTRRVKGMFNREPAEIFNDGQFPIQSNQLSFQGFHSDLGSVSVNSRLTYGGVEYKVVAIEKSASNIFIKLFLHKTT